MYAQFEYHAPTSFEELFALLAELESALIYAGGTDLLVQLRAHQTDAAALIDIKRISGMEAITETGTHLEVGAAVRFFDLEQSVAIQRRALPLAQAASQVGSVQIRFKGTLCGNIQTASPAGDGLNALWPFDAHLALRSREGQRTLPLTEFLTGPRKTLLAAGEVISHISIPHQRWDFARFFKVGRRNALAISVVNGVVAIKNDANGLPCDVRISLGAVAPTPIRIFEAEQSLIGRALTSVRIEEAARIVRSTVRPISDVRASAQYRAYIAGTMVQEQLTSYLEAMA